MSAPKPAPFREIESPAAAGQKHFDFSQDSRPLEGGHVRTRASALSAQRACLLHELRSVVDSSVKEASRRRAMSGRLQCAIASEPVPELREAILSLRAALDVVANRQEYVTREFVVKQAIPAMDKYEANR